MSERRIVSLGHKLVGDEYPPFLALEAGATHFGFQNAITLVRCARHADGIKFQTVWADNLMSAVKLRMKYRSHDGEHEGDLYDLLKAREMSKEEWTSLAKFATNEGVFWFTTPDSPETIDFLHRRGLLGAIKIAGGDMTHIPLIKYAASTGLPILLDTRGTLEEVDTAVQACEMANNHSIIIVHCPSGYPTPNAGLNMIPTYRERYSYPIGFSDHSPGLDTSIMAVALGANFIEKVVSSNPMHPGIEHIMALPTSDVQEAKDRLVEAWKAMNVQAAPAGYTDARRSVCTGPNGLEAGEEITMDKVVFRRPGTGWPPGLVDVLVGRKAKCRIEPNMPVFVDQLE